MNVHDRHHISRYKVQVRRRRFSWYWRLVSGNGEVIAHSETYSRKSKALQTAERLAYGVGWELDV